jgi:hypothetical protein
MHPHATFNADFPNQEAFEPPGRPLADYLAESLRLAGYVVTVDNWRDVGWSVDLNIDGAAVYLYFAAFEGPDDWLLCCTSDVGLIKRLFGRPTNEKQKRTLAILVDKALKADLRVSNIRWYSNFRGSKGASSATRADELPPA